MRSFSELVNQFVHFLVALPNLLVTFGPCDHNFPWHKYQKGHRRVGRFDPIHKSREYLGLVLDLAAFFAFGLLLVSVLFQSLQVDGHFHVTRRHYVLDFEVVVINFECHSLNYFGVLAAGQFAIFLGLGPSNDHLPATENKPCSFGVAQSHYYGCKSIGVVLSGLAFPGDLFEVKLASKIDCANNVLDPRQALFRNGAVYSLHSCCHIYYRLDERVFYFLITIIIFTL